jgi:hypothetical protein
MSTLGTMKSIIGDDLARSDLTSQIAAAITQAIEYYKTENFWWQQTRTIEFDTVIGTYSYSSDPINSIAQIDEVMNFDSGGTIYGVDRMDPMELDALVEDNGASSGRPIWYSYYEEVFRLYPIPDDVYTIRINGLIERAAPTSDDATGNYWMLPAYAQELIRCRAKFYLYDHTIQAPEKAAAFGALADMELARLRRETSQRTATGQIQPTVF